MQWTYYRTQLQLILTRKKNWVALVAVVVALVAFGLKYNAASQPREKLVPTVLRNEVRSIKAAQRHGRNFTESPVTMIRIDTDVLNGVNGAREDLVEAYDTKLLSYLRNLDTPPYSLPAGYYQDKSPQADPVRDGAYGVQRMMARMDYYLMNPDIPVTLAVINEQTGMQTLVRMSETWLPWGLLLLAMFLACDVIAADWRHDSITGALPVQGRTKLVLKALAVMTVVVVTGLVVGGIVILAAALGHGLGASAGVMRHVGLDFDFEPLPILTYWAQFTGLALLLSWLAVRLMMLLQLIARNETFAFVVGGLLFCLPMAYYVRDYGLTRRWPMWLPMTYTDLGAVVTGHTEFLYGNPQMTVGLAALVLLGWILVVEGCLAGAQHWAQKGRLAG